MYYVERDCTIEHEGRRFGALGSVVTPYSATGYLDCGNLDESSPLTVIGWRITDWHGRVIGTVESVTSWPVRSYVTDRMYQVTARIDGVRYTGRSAGTGMIWNGKRTTRQ